MSRFFLYVTIISNKKKPWPFYLNELNGRIKILRGAKFGRNWTSCLGGKELKKSLNDLEFPYALCYGCLIITHSGFREDGGRKKPLA